MPYSASTLRWGRAIQAFARASCAATRSASSSAASSTRRSSMEIMPRQPCRGEPAPSVPGRARPRHDLTEVIPCLTDRQLTHAPNVQSTASLGAAPTHAGQVLATAQLSAKRDSTPVATGQVTPVATMLRCHVTRDGRGWLIRSWRCRLPRATKAGCPRCCNDRIWQPVCAPWRRVGSPTSVTAPVAGISSAPAVIPHQCFHPMS